MLDVSELPFKLPAYVAITSRARSKDYTDYSLSVKIGRRKPLPLGRMTVRDDGGVELVKSRFHGTEIQVKSWDEVVSWITGVEGLPVKFVSVDFTKGEL